MNYTDPHTYLKPPAMRPMDMYSVKSQMANNLSLTADSLVNLGTVSNDHALRIDELRNDFENMKALLTWIGEVHPEVVKQHYALRDIERASK